MHPISETVEAFTELTRGGDRATVLKLGAISHAVEQVVPESIALSVTFVDGRLSFTMTAGPVRASTSPPGTDGGPRSDTQPEPVVEVSASLSLPLVHRGALVGIVDLDASTPDAFEGHYDELAEVCGAWPAGATRDADTPHRIRSDRLVDRAIGALMARVGISIAEAERRLMESARHARVSEPQMARAILDGPAP